MVQQQRKTTARKAAPKKSAAQPKAESGNDDATLEGETEELTATSPQPPVDGTVLDSESSRRTETSDNVVGGERHRDTETVDTRRTTVEYESGHIVEESTTVTTTRRERIPLPYAGPVSEHPAPVG